MLSSRQHILIAGGAGFIGSHLCDYFLQKGYKVTCLDNLLTGRLENIQHLIDNKKLTFKNKDITELFTVEDEIHFILNMASPASPFDYQNYPLETLNVGSMGTRQLLELARQKNAVFLMASTSEVYGDPLVHPQKEEYWGNVNPVGIRSCYDEAKRFSESLTMAYHRKYGLKTRIVRIFNTYGPNMRLNDGRALPAFLSQALTGKDITVFGNGSQTRSFCYVSDMVAGIAKLLFSDETGPTNIGNPQEMTLLDFAKLVLQLTQSQSKIIFHPLPEDDPKKRCPNISKARHVLGWEPKVSPEEGLKKTIPYFVEQLQIARSQTV